MARIVRVVDSPKDVGVVETRGAIPYRRRWESRGPLVFVLILALIVIWIYRNGSMGILNMARSDEITMPGSVPPAKIETGPVIPPLAVEEAPGTVEERPGITADQQSDIMGYSRVISERLNLRERPGVQYYVLSNLPRYWEVAILRQLHITPNGEKWVEVLADTGRGWQKGWVMTRYLEPCNCPIY